MKDQHSRAYGVATLSSLLLGVLWAGTAGAQWSGTNPLTTSSTVGIGTTAPVAPLHVSGNNIRLVLDSTDTNSTNTGIAIATGGASKWSLAHVRAPGEFPFSYFTIFNDATGQEALRVSASNNRIFTFAQLNTQSVLPNADNTHNLGSSTRRWNLIFSSHSLQTSDGRLKKEVKDLSYGLADVLKLRPVEFKWKAGATPPLTSA